MPHSLYIHMYVVGFTFRFFISNRRLSLVLRIQQHYRTCVYLA